MWRSIVLTLLLGALGSTSYPFDFDFEYLNPIKLQTKVPPAIQKKAAIDIITKYTLKTRVEIDNRYFYFNKDSFHLITNKGLLYINASTGVAAVWGFNYYLKKYCKSQIEWQTKNVNIPKRLPAVDELIVANDRFRYYQNVRTVSVSFVWWDVHDWRQHVEWMALNGINLVLAPVAQEAAWAQVYRKVGMTQKEIDKHFTGPAFLSWLRLGNIHGWGGPLPKSWHNLQAKIQNDIIKRMRNLGMVHVLPAFNGHVPMAFEKLFPNTTFHKVDQWNKFSSDYCCGLFLNPLDPMFAVIGKMFLDEVTTKAPVSHIYTADPFNEIHTSILSTTLVMETAKRIFNTIADFDKNAVWLLQNWMLMAAPLSWPLKRAKTFIKSVPIGRMLILDLQSEQWPQYDVYQMYFGQPFIWCMLHNFGGTLGMHGNMVTINKDVYEVRSRANSTMLGIGLTPEGINQNYVVYDLMLESAWRKFPVKHLDAWVADYAERRYGCSVTAEAWKHLLKSVYSFNGLNRVRGQYVVTQRPSFKIKPWAWYKSSHLFEAFKELVLINDDRCHTDGYHYDVVDVTRQALQYRAEQLYVNVVKDRSTNSFIYEASINRFLDVLNDLGKLLHESEYFTAARWFKKPRLLGSDIDEANLYEFNARNQITLFGPNGEHADYACKQWSSLYKYYYYPRWNIFLNATLQAKRTGEDLNEKAIRRVVAAIVEVPFVANNSEGTHIYWPVYSRALDMAKRLYAKWHQALDVEDLPENILKASDLKQGGSSVIGKERQAEKKKDI